MYKREHSKATISSFKTNTTTTVSYRKKMKWEEVWLNFINTKLASRRRDMGTKQQRGKKLYGGRRNWAEQSI